MKKKTIRIEAMHVNNEERKLANERFIKKINEAQIKIERIEDGITTSEERRKEKYESEKEKIANKYSDDLTQRDKEIERLHTKLLQQQENYKETERGRIKKLKETAEQPVDGDYYNIPATAEQFSVKIEDEIFKIGNWYSLYVNREETVSPDLAYTWNPEIGNGELNLEITTNSKPVLDVKTGYDGVERVALLYPKVENPVGIELIIFYENEFA